MDLNEFRRKSLEKRQAAAAERHEKIIEMWPHTYRKRDCRKTRRWLQHRFRRHYATSETGTHQTKKTGQTEKKGGES